MKIKGLMIVISLWTMSSAFGQSLELDKTSIKSNGVVKYWVIE